MSQSNLLLLNVFATMSRMIATVFMGLWTTRLAYQQLGEAGFGAYAAVLAWVSMFAFVTETFSLAAQRHIAHAIGAKDEPELRSVTGTFVTMALGMSTLLVVGVFLFAPWLAQLVQAPAEHRDELALTFRWVGGALGLVILQAPLKAYLIARQSIVVVSVFELFESAARLVAAAWLLWFSEPSIAVYARNICVCIAPHTIGLLVACFIGYPATRPFVFSAWRKIAGLGFWMTLGSAGWSLRTMVAQLTTNALCGAAASASYSIGLQIANYQNNLRNAVYRAIRPAAVTAEGRGATEQVTQLSLSSSKLMGLVCLFLAAPVLIDTPTLLKLWLGEVGQDAVWVVRLTFLWVCLKDLTVGYMLAIHARGRVALHESLRTGIDAAAVCIAAVVVYYGGPVWTFPAAILGAVFCQILMHVFWFGEAARTTPSEWAHGVLLPFTQVALLAGCCALPVTLLMAPSATRLLVLTVVSVVVSGVGIVTIGLNNMERDRLLHAFRSLKGRVFGRGA